MIWWETGAVSFDLIFFRGEDFIVCIFVYFIAMDLRPALCEPMISIR